MPRFMIFVGIAATHLPCQVLAQQHGFISVGVGASHISSERFEVHDATRPSFGVRAGTGGSRVMVVLDWQRHGLGDEEPLASDWPPESDTPTRVPQVLEADFFLLGVQIYLARAVYLRPALGVGRHAFNTYGYSDLERLQPPYVAKEAGPAAGLSLGYHLKVHRRFSLGIETSLLFLATIEGGEERRALGIQVTPLLDF